MYITPVNPKTFKGYEKPVKILKNNVINRNREFLYNEVMDITKEFHIPATFHNEGIELPSPTTEAVNALKKLGIKYTSLSK